MRDLSNRRRTIRRLLFALGLVAAGLVLSACHGGPHVIFVVTTLVDGDDAVPGDGVCEKTVGAGDCSLRAAITEGNAAAAVPVIVVGPGVYTLASTAGENANAAGDLDIKPVSGGMIVVSSGVMVDTAGGPRGIDVHSGAVALLGVGARGGTIDGIVVRGGATVVLGWSSVISDADAGDGIWVKFGGSLTVANTTVSSNEGFGVIADGAVDAKFVTITDNARGGLTGPGAVTLEASIVADNDGEDDCAFAVTSRGYNLDSDGTCGLADPTDVSRVSAVLSPSDTTMPFHVPTAASPALDSIPGGVGPCVGANDQRVTLRPIGGGCDRGAIEAGVFDAFTVNTGVDGVDADPGDGVCEATVGVGDCTLRAAADEANADPEPSVIDILAGVDPTLSLANAAPSSGEDANLTGDVDFTATVTIFGNGNTVTGDGTFRIFDLHSGVLDLSDLTVVGGHAPEWLLGAESGGGLRAAGDVVIASSTFRGNTAGTGSAVVISGADLTIDSSVFEDNIGRAISGTDSSIDIVSSTFARNGTKAIITRPMSGGAVELIDGTLMIDDSLFDGNTLLGALPALPFIKSIYVLDGSAVRADTADVTISDSTFTGNSGTLSNGTVSLVGSDAVIAGSTFDSNSSDGVVYDPGGLAFPAGGQGGALFVHASGGPSPVPSTLMLRNSTLHGNSSSLAAVVAVGEGSVLTATGSTFSDNAGGALELWVPWGDPQPPGVITLSGSAAAAAGGDVVCTGPILSGGFNVVSDVSCGLAGTGDAEGVDPLLDVLADNGGPTFTQLLLVGSAARDLIPPGTVGLCDAGVTDQRGVARPVGTSCDAGATEQ